MAAFLPDYRAVPTSKGWRPSYRLFEGQKEKLVPYKGGPRFFDTAEEARAAAREYLRPHLNPPLAAGEIPLEQELSEIEQWRREKAEQEEAERRKVFGEMPTKVVFTRSGRAVEVETMSRRRMKA